MRTTSCVIQLIVLVLILFAAAMTVRRALVDRDDLVRPTATIAAVTPDAEVDNPSTPVPDTEQLSHPAVTDETEAETVDRDDSQDMLVVDGLRFVTSSTMTMPAGEVRGLAANSDTLYIALFNATDGQAYLVQSPIERPSVAQMRGVGPEGYMPGGLHMGSTMLWVPLMANSEPGPSMIVGMDPRYLADDHSFQVNDRIRAVAESDSGTIFGFNADSSLLYEWKANGDELRRFQNKSGATYHDLEWARGSLVCAGYDALGGLVDVIDPQSMTMLVRYRVNMRISAEGSLTSGGFALVGDMLYFVLDGPDGSPVLMAYKPNSDSITDFVPSVAD